MRCASDPKTTSYSVICVTTVIGECKAMQGSAERNIRNDANHLACDASPTSCDAKISRLSRIDDANDASDATAGCSTNRSGTSPRRMPTGRPRWPKSPPRCQVEPNADQREEAPTTWGLVGVAGYRPSPPRVLVPRRRAPGRGTRSSRPRRRWWTPHRTADRTSPYSLDP